jgi:tetratricopeptide (TPR) repeat protein
MSNSRPGRWPWLLGIACLLLLVMGLLVRRHGETRSQINDSSARSTSADAAADGKSLRIPRARGNSALTAEQIVSSKMRQYGRSRREYVHAMARRANKDVPREVEDFFDALERGNWEEVEARFKALRPGDGKDWALRPELPEIWPAILDAYGAAQEAHLWPAQKLLDYGNAVLDSLRPGMVYVGGTDPGRWIPALLNDTRDGERHIVLTQNAFADKRYLDYVAFQYGDRFAPLTHSDSERAFADYMADAQKRLEHDRQFPNEPRQIRPGEDVKMLDGKLQVSGQVSVQAINERLFQRLLEMNPELSFAMEESFPYKSVLADASPLGPIMEVRPRDQQNAFTPERAAETVDYWRNATGQLLNDPDAQASDAVRKSYSKLLSSQGGLFEQRKHMAEAEQLFRLANEVCPSSPEAVFRYINLLVSQGRVNETLPVVQNALRAEPNNQQFQGLQTELSRLAQNPTR